MNKSGTRKVSYKPYVSVYNVPKGEENVIARQSILNRTPHPEPQLQLNQVESVAYANLFAPPRKANGSPNYNFKGYSTNKIMKKIKTMKLPRASKEKLWLKYHFNGHANNNNTNNNRNNRDNRNNSNSQSAASTVSINEGTPVRNYPGRNNAFNKIKNWI